MKIKVKVDGLKETQAAFHALKPATGLGVMRRVLTRSLAPMLATAQELAPDDPRTPAPRDLKSSLAISTDQRGGGEKVQRARDARGRYVRVYMGPTREGYPQAMPQEFGAVQHPAHPFMRPAWEQHAEGALDIIKDELAAEIDKTAARIAKRAARSSKKG